MHLGLDLTWHSKLSAIEGNNVGTSSRLLATTPLPRFPGQKKRAEGQRKWTKQKRCRQLDRNEEQKIKVMTHSRVLLL